MFEEEDAEKLRIQSQEKFELSKTLLAKLQNYFSLHPRVKGMSKLVHRIIAESQFLQRLVDGSAAISQSHLNCSNLPYFSAAMEWLEKLTDVVAVEHRFSAKDGTSQQVDIVAEGGALWVKIKARNSTALDSIFLEEKQELMLAVDEPSSASAMKKATPAEPAEEEDESAAAAEESTSRRSNQSVMGIAARLLKCSQDNAYCFAPPRVLMCFAQGVSTAVAKQLEQMGVTVEGKRLESSEALLSILAQQQQQQSDSKKKSASDSDQEISNASDLDQEGEDEENGESDFEFDIALGQGMDESTVLDPENEQAIDDILKEIHSSPSPSAAAAAAILGSVDEADEKKEEAEEENERDEGEEEEEEGPEEDEVEEKKQPGKKVHRKQHEVRKQKSAAARAAGAALDSSSASSSSAAAASSASASLPPASLLNCVNLDISSLLTIVSDLTNGGARSQDVDRFLSVAGHEDMLDKMILHQLKMERETPCLPSLLPYLRGKELICCATAYNRFVHIVSTLAGPREYQRARLVASRLRVVKDEPSSNALAMAAGRKSSDSYIIFGTGDKLRVPTLTANSSFCRSATQAGYTFTTHVHPAAALTERKFSRAFFYAGLFASEAEALLAWSKHCTLVDSTFESVFPLPAAAAAAAPPLSLGSSSASSFSAAVSSPLVPASSSSSSSSSEQSSSAINELDVTTSMLSHLTVPQTVDSGAIIDAFPASPINKSFAAEEVAIEDFLKRKKAADKMKSQAALPASGPAGGRTAAKKRKAAAAAAAAKKPAAAAAAPSSVPQSD